MPDQSRPDYEITNLCPGDLVMLRWTGDRRVPNREGDSWATVDEVKGDRVTVCVCGYGTTRYITVDHIARVDRKVKRNTYERTADRVQTRGGTRLAHL